MGGGIMKMLAGPTMEIVGHITQQIGIMEDVRSRVGSMSQALGGAWVGQDADAFMQEIATRVIPEIMDLIAAIGGMPGGFSQMMDITRGADSNARGRIAGLGDMFGSIF